jgi:hypothetical protein
MIAPRGVEHVIREAKSQPAPPFWPPSADLKRKSSISQAHLVDWRVAGETPCARRQAPADPIFRTRMDGNRGNRVIL